jgi:ribonuclease HI
MYEVYTDGSCLGNPGRGGWGVVSDNFKLCAGQPNYTDSNYVKQGITQWVHNWKRNGWKTSTGGDVKNKELWIQIDTLRGQMKEVEWRWVKAHNGDPKNEEVDKLARDCAKKVSM